MKKHKNNLSLLKVVIFVIPTFLVLTLSSINYIIYRLFYYKQIILIILISISIIYFIKIAFNYNIRKYVRERYLLYPIILTFLVFYFAYFPGNSSLVLAFTSITTTTIPASNSVSLSLSPNPASPSSTIKATISISGSASGYLYVRSNTCYGEIQCNCYSSSSGCPCTFTAPPSPGSYDYITCVDFDNDWDYDDPGEQSKVTLVVQGATTTTTSITTTTIPAGASVSLSLSPNYVSPPSKVTATISIHGTTYSGYLQVRYSSCTGEMQCNCYSFSDGCPCQFDVDANTPPGIYKYVTCVDFNGNWVEDPGEKGEATLFVQGATTTTTICPDSMCPAIDSDDGEDIFKKGVCKRRYCDANDECQISYEEWDRCEGDFVLEFKRDPNSPNICTGVVIPCPANYKCQDGHCIPVTTTTLPLCEIS
jgi:hypothetical protein